MHARFSDSISSICADDITHAEINKHQQFLALALSLSRPFVLRIQGGEKKVTGSVAELMLLLVCLV